MNAAGLKKWAAKYVRTHSWSVYDVAHPRRQKYDEVALQRGEVLRFLEEQGARARVDELRGKPPEVTLLNFAIRADDHELVLALLAAGASPTRIFLEPARATEGPGAIYVLQRPLWLARQREATLLVAALSTPEVLAVEAEDERRIAAKTPAPGAKHADVYILPARWVFVPQSGGRGVSRWAPRATAVERNASVAEIVRALHATLGRFTRELVDDADMKRAKRDTFAAAHVSSYRSLVASAQLVSVWEDPAKMVFDRWRPDGVGYAFGGEPLVLTLPASEATIVETLQRAAEPDPVI